MNLYFSNNAKIEIFPRLCRTPNVKESLISFCRKLGQIHVVSFGITVIKEVKSELSLKLRINFAGNKTN